MALLQHLQKELRQLPALFGTLYLANSCFGEALKVKLGSH